MTRPLPFTELSLRRAISAAQKAGLKVTAIKPDGTLITVPVGKVFTSDDEDLDVNRGDNAKWLDVQA
jgi:hypothetical protein